MLLKLFVKPLVHKVPSGHFLQNRLRGASAKRPGAQAFARTRMLSAASIQLTLEEALSRDPGLQHQKHLRADPRVIANGRVVKLMCSWRTPHDFQNLRGNGIPCSFYACRCSDTQCVSSQVAPDRHLGRKSAL